MQLARAYRRVFHGTVFAALLLQLAYLADANYRGRDGRLGATVPPWQTEIAGGTAPAPYVYRQTVPQLRRLAGGLLAPGHAALGVDLAFGAVAIAAGFAVGRAAFGAGLAFLGAVAVTLALASVYPNDKPESIAMVAASVVATAFLLRGRLGATALTCAVAAPIRPELPVLFGAALLLACATCASGPGRRRALTVSAACLAAGLAYLGAARWLLWPAASYPEPTPVVTLLENLAHPVRYPGLALASALGALGGYWCVRAWACRERPAAVAGWPSPALIQLAIGLYTAAWCAAWVVLGRADEIRLAMPVLPAGLVLAGGLWAPRDVDARASDAEART
jgi:hypothetical protein